jgi:hypothetical protein
MVVLRPLTDAMILDDRNILDRVPPGMIIYFPKERFTVELKVRIDVQHHPVRRNFSLRLRAPNILFVEMRDDYLANVCEECRAMKYRNANRKHWHDLKSYRMVSELKNVKGLDRPFDVKFFDRPCKKALERQKQRQKQQQKRERREKGGKRG